MAEAAPTLYCVCQQIDNAGIMIECIRSSGGCNGWVHPTCCGLNLSTQELEAMKDYICPLCEQPDDDYKKLKAVNTKAANKAARKARKKAMAKQPSTTWICSSCTFENSEVSLECVECFTSRDGTKRRSRRDNSNRKSYHVPASGDEETEDDDDGQPKTKKRRSSTPENNTEMVVEEQEREISTPTSFIIEKIMGVRDTMTSESVAVKEYYIKWKGFSYMHASWEFYDTLVNLDYANKHRVKRFEEKRLQRQVFITGDEEEHFNPDFLEIHRVIAERVDSPLNLESDEENEKKDDGLRFLIKWNSLPYSECTWERGCDVVNDAAIEKFRQQNICPSEKKWKRLPHPAIRDYKKLDTSPAYGADGTLKLRDYQLEGVNWLLWNWYNKRPSILADEMGLGKTIQTLSFLHLLGVNSKIRSRGPFLVVAPLSLIQQWQNECDTWTKMDCVVYHGNTECRQVIQEYEFYYLTPDGKPDKKKPIKFNILVTTYEVAIKDIRLLSRIDWRCLIVDEAHRLKNHQSRLVEQLRSIRRDHCILLTGTPLQNKTEELWALLHFIDSSTFPSINAFLENFGNLQDSKQVADLHKMLKPFLLRRVKEDVEKSLPPKEETIVEVELTSIQKQWYRAIYEKNTSFLYRGGKPSNAPNLMNIMMELRKCCNHPYLNNGVEAAVSEGLVTDQQKHDMMVKCCGKMVLLDKLLPRLKEGGHKILIFSQMVRVLDILEDYLRFMGYIYERLDGNIRGNDRQGAIDRFVKPEYNRFVMLLSTKAGGLGLNLTAADTVIIFDSDWNPQNDLQAQARAHRIGQTNSVKIYRLITRKTYEMHMFHRASLKLGLDQAVLTHMRQENEKGHNKSAKKTNKIQDAAEIDELLKKGAYDVFREDDTAADQFCAADIDQILQRSSKLVTYEQTARSQFSKASFVSATTANDVDIDDPDFWKKAVGLDEPEPLVDESFLIPSMRKRTRVSRFGAVEDSDSELDDNDDDDSRDETENTTGTGTNTEKTSKEPREWTINGRDRLQRALMHFGFGRWNTIRNQSGGSRRVEDAEAFARAFILQCGLCAIEGQGSKDDSPFVKGAIRAAQAVEKEYFDQETMPTVLSDADFVSKLKQGGARRVLVRMDMLLRLHRIVTQACEAIESRRKTDEEEKQDPTALDLDARVEYHGEATVADAIDILDVGERPSWSKLTHWWDVEADRHILMGVFLHGYGRCSQILGDSRLCFARRAAADVPEQDALDEEMKKGPIKVEETKEECKPSPPAEGDSDLEDSDATVSDDDDGTGTVTDEENESASATEVSTTRAFRMPEVQQINRLLFWLLSAEDIKRQQDEEARRLERVEAEQKRQQELDRKQKQAALKRAEAKSLELVQMDILRHEAYLYNVRASHGDQILPRTKDWSKDERRSLCYVIATLGIPIQRTLSDDSTISSPEENELSWSDLIQIAHLQKSKRQVERFVVEKFLPKCSRVSQLKIDPLAADQRLSAVHGLGGIEYVDVMVKTHSHGLKAKHIANIILRRVQLYKVVHHLITTKPQSVLTYLKSEQGRMVDEMPVWWCPWIHDYGILQGMKKHGVFAWKSIRSDLSLPFHTKAVQDHIRLVFLDGSREKSLLEQVLKTRAEMNVWFKSIVDTFPCVMVLERRIQHLASVLTREEEDESLRMKEPTGSFENISFESFHSILTSRETMPNEMDETTRDEELKRLQTFLKETKSKRDGILKSQNFKDKLTQRLQDEVE